MNERTSIARMRVLSADLPHRFEIVPSSLTERVCTIADLGILKYLLKKAVTVESLNEFEDLVKQMMEY